MKFIFPTKKYLVSVLNGILCSKDTAVLACPQQPLLPCSGQSGDAVSMAGSRDAADSLAGPAGFLLVLLEELLGCCLQVGSPAQAVPLPVPAAGAVRVLRAAQRLEGRRRRSEEERTRRRLCEGRDERSRVRRAGPSPLPQTGEASASGAEPVDGWGQRAARAVLQKSARREPNLVKMGIVGKCVLHGEMN